MTDTMESGEMRMIPIDLIDVLNTRERNKGVFDEIVGNIKAIGLKKPITVTPRPRPDGTERYMLICGEGRLKAFLSLGEKAIPALVVAVSDENAYIMSLQRTLPVASTDRWNCWLASSSFGTKATTKRSSPRRLA